MCVLKFNDTNYESNYPSALIKNQQLNCAIMDGFQPLTLIIPDPFELLLIILCLIIALLNPSCTFIPFLALRWLRDEFVIFGPHFRSLICCFCKFLLLFEQRTGS